MKKKGFTLVELLAVIVILAIIALIATPMIMNVIERSKRGAAIESVNGILDAAEKYQMDSMLDQKQPLTVIDLKSDILKYKGSKPESGSLLIDQKGKMSAIAKYGNYCIEKKFADEGPKLVEKEQCDIDDSELLMVGETAVVEYRMIQAVNDVLNQAKAYQSKTENYETIIDLFTTNIFTYKGSKPESGTLLIGGPEKMSITAKFGNYCVEKKFTDDNPKIVQKDPCAIDATELEAMKYSEVTLNGADPVLKEGLIPITISSDGTVKKADTKEKWYHYANKEWANAVILKDTSVVYSNGDTIPESNIESYFVWIPKYSYQLWDLGKYTSNTSLDTTKKHAISIRFGLTNTDNSIEGECTTPLTTGASGTCQVGDYMTHPAFLAFDTNGLWVGKFETGKVNSAIHIKPNIAPWRSIKLGDAFKKSYEYKRAYDSHMMKNTEWGAVLYLSHSEYGINQDIAAKTHQTLTGYAGNASKYNTATGYTASTTGNITGIYDMSGIKNAEFVMGYVENPYTIGGRSSITTYYSDFFTNTAWKKYYDLYNGKTTTGYNKRILGDATGELGPFGTNGASSWYGTWDTMVANDGWANDAYWVYRGGYTGQSGGSAFEFNRCMGEEDTTLTFRLVLAPQ